MLHDKDNFYKQLSNIFSLRITNKDTYVDHDKENPIIKDEYFGRDKFSLDVEMDNEKVFDTHIHWTSILYEEKQGI